MGIEAVGAALERHGAPRIFNTDQKIQLTIEVLIGLLNDSGFQISMDGK